jgi:hypothetical protein
MMISPILTEQQDTLQHKIKNQLSDSGDLAGSRLLKHQSADSLHHRISVIKQTVPAETDTVSVCSRNSIADVTFYDLNNFILRMGYGTPKQFPYVLVEQGKKRETENKAFLVKHLKEGSILPPQPLHSDWIILIVILTAALFTLVKTSSGQLSSSFSKYIMFRGVNESVSREVLGLFYWQSTILNLVSFFIIALFGYTAASYYNLLPVGFKGILPWTAILVVISIGITLRHFTCVITGAASGREEAFREYLLSVYQAYRFAGLFLFAIVILISYTKFLPVNALIISGLIIIGLTYLFRVIRLLIIFINRNISIFYLILYLCALEILPVLVIAKYFTGLD